MRKLIKVLIVVFVTVFMFLAINLFRGTKICWGVPVDKDGNGIPENCFVSSD